MLPILSGLSIPACAPQPACRRPGWLATLSQRLPIRTGILFVTVGAGSACCGRFVCIET